MNNVENNLPPLKRQNLQSLSLLIIVLIIISCFHFIIRMIIDHLYTDDAVEIQSTLWDISIYILQPTSAILFIIILWMFNDYLTNFKTASNAQFPLLFIIVLTAIDTLFYMYINTVVMHQFNLSSIFNELFSTNFWYAYTILIDIIEVCLYILWGIVAYFLFTEKNDYVGGLKNLGIGIYIFVGMKLSMFLIDHFYTSILDRTSYFVYEFIFSLIIPILLYLVIAKAIKYSKQYGFRKRMTRHNNNLN